MSSRKLRRSSRPHSPAGCMRKTAGPIRFFPAHALKKSPQDPIDPEPTHGILP